jgi:MFS family permease
VAPTRLRGAFGTWNQLLITSGNLTALVINALVPAEHWRWVMALSALPTLFLLLGMCCICPETPRWLMHQRKSEEAARAAKWLWGDAATSELEVRPTSATHSLLPSCPTAPDRTQCPILHQVHPSPEDDEPQAAFSELFAKPNRMVAATAVMMFLLQQFAGINALVYFSSTIFKQVRPRRGPS